MGRPAERPRQHEAPVVRAEATGLKQGDILAEVAGATPKQAGEIKPIVDRVAPGTWLPLKILREAQKLELVVRFPREARPD